MTSGVYVRTLKTIESLRLSHLGKKGFWDGKNRSIEDKIKMGLPKKGKKLSKEHAEKVR